MILQLDPPAVATNRAMLDLNADGGSIAVDEGGIDWGQASIDAYLADKKYGSVVVDHRVPNRVITVPLGLGMNDAGDMEIWRNQLEQKVGLLQDEGGWLLRQRPGGPAMYADVVDADLTIPDDLGEAAGLEAGVTLTLTCLPDFYGDEITLDAISGTGLINAILKSGGVQAAIKGHTPGRARMIVSDTSGNDQKGLIWGLRSRHYDSAATAKLFYEAEALTPLSGATTSALAGASGGSRVQLASLVGGAWVPILSTQLASGGAQLSHTGSYRVWARVYSASAIPWLRLLWAVGDLANPVTNDAAQLPSPAASFYLVDLGEIRVDAPPIGNAVWQGVIQAMGNSDGDPVSIDCLYFQPLDEGAGYLQAVQPKNLSSSVADGPHTPTTGADDAGVGTIAWVNPGTVTAEDSYSASAEQINFQGVSTTHYLKGTGPGFTVPAGATMTGILLGIKKAWGGDVGKIQPEKDYITDARVRLIKAGAIQGTERADVSTRWPPTLDWAWYGGSTDMWGTTWTPADVNNSGFGAAIAATMTNADAALFYALVDVMLIWVYFTLGSGFTVAQEAVLYANRTLELRHDGAWRTDPGGSFYGPAPVPISDLPRVPTSNIEGRPVEVFVKRTRGDLDQLPDAGLDAGSLTFKYRPCYLGRI